MDIRNNRDSNRGTEDRISRKNKKNKEKGWKGSKSSKRNGESRS